MPNDQTVVMLADKKNQVDQQPTMVENYKSDLPFSKARSVALIIVLTGASFLNASINPPSLPQVANLADPLPTKRYYHPPNNRRGAFYPRK